MLDQWKQNKAENIINTQNMLNTIATMISLFRHFLSHLTFPYGDRQVSYMRGIQT